MSNQDAKTTIYLSPIVRHVQKQVIYTDQTVSEYVNRAVANANAEDLEDIEVIEARRTEQTEPLDNFWKAIREASFI